MRAVLTEKCCWELQKSNCAPCGAEYDNEMQYNALNLNWTSHQNGEAWGGEEEIYRTVQNKYKCDSHPTSVIFYFMLKDFLYFLLKAKDRLYSQTLKMKLQQ